MEKFENVVENKNVVNFLAQDVCEQNVCEKANFLNPMYNRHIVGHSDSYFEDM